MIWTSKLKLKGVWFVFKIKLKCNSFQTRNSLQMKTSFQMCKLPKSEAEEWQDSLDRPRCAVRFAYQPGSHTNSRRPAYNGPNTKWHRARPCGSQRPTTACQPLLPYSADWPGTASPHTWLGSTSPCRPG